MLSVFKPAPFPLIESNNYTINHVKFGYTLIFFCDHLKEVFLFVCNKRVTAYTNNLLCLYNLYYNFD